MRENTVPLVRVEGEPRARGRQYGAACKTKIKRMLEVYKGWFKEYVNVEWSAARKNAEAYASCIKIYDEEIYEEMQGIAEGSGADLLDIVTINARSEIASANLPLHKNNNISLEGCTSLAFTESSKGVLIGQNWDWMPHTSDCLVFLRVVQPGRPSIITMTEAGLIGKIGVNAAGLALCLNFLASEQNEIGVPCHVLCRSVLNSWNLGKGIGEVARADRAGSANFLLGHADGEALALEFTVKDFAVRYPTGGVIAHTNHFHSGLPMVDKVKSLRPDTLVRYMRAIKLMDYYKGLEVEGMSKVLRDHFNYPDAICRHPDLNKPEWQRIQTNFSFILSLKEKVMHYTESHPCGQEYRRLSYIDL